MITKTELDRLVRIREAPEREASSSEPQGLERYPQDEEQNEYRYIDYRWLDKVAEGLTEGARKHPGETWRDIPAREHAVRALRHLSLWLAGDTSEPHLVNASMRVMMAFALAEGRDGEV